MFETASVKNQMVLKFPTLTVRSFLFGMTVMNVLNGIMIILILCFAPLIMLLMSGILHPDILKLHVIALGLLFIAISFGLNVFWIGTLCFRGLFTSLNTRIFVVVILTAWHLLLWYLNQADYLDIALVSALLCVSLWDRFYPEQEKP
jgi:hypothetical protein